MQKKKRTCRSIWEKLDTQIPFMPKDSGGVLQLSSRSESLRSSSGRDSKALQEKKKQIGQELQVLGHWTTNTHAHKYFAFIFNLF